MKIPKSYIITIVILMSNIAWAGNPDQIDIKEALTAGVISLTFKGLDGGEKMEIEVEKVLSIPMIIIIEKGAVDFGDVKVIASNRISVDLSTKSKDSFTLFQTGDRRMTQGSVMQSYLLSEKTATLYSRLKNSKNHMLQELIEMLGSNNAWEKKGAIKALAEIGDDLAIIKLKDLIESAPNNEIQSLAREAIEKINSPEKP